VKNIIETLAGMFVLIVAAFFLWFAYTGANMSNLKNNYTVIAKFSQASGISVGSDVRISGVKIGHVSKQYLDFTNFKAVLECSVNKDIKLPVDSSAAIVSDGLLGGKYVSIDIGADDVNLLDRQEIKFTQSSVNLETLIGKMIFNSNDNKSAN
jgi:phospholipid/cholesterol/gamma-HCH transport system substrate-binding protein